MTKRVPESIRFGVRLVLLGPGIAILVVATALLLLVLAVLLLVSLSGVLALAAALAGLLFIIGGTLLWPVRKYARTWIAGALSALMVILVNKTKDRP